MSLSSGGSPVGFSIDIGCTAKGHGEETCSKSRADQRAVKAEMQGTREEAGAALARRRARSLSVRPLDCLQNHVLPENKESVHVLAAAIEAQQHYGQGTAPNGIPFSSGSVKNPKRNFTGWGREHMVSAPIVATKEDWQDARWRLVSQNWCCVTSSRPLVYRRYWF